MKKSIWIHLGIIAAMFAAACIYMAPALSGKAIPQGDTQKYEAMARAQKEAAKHTGKVPNWSPSMFSGMPGYQITSEPQHSVFNPIKAVTTLNGSNLSGNIAILFLYMLGFYVALLALGLSPWTSLVGAVAFALGSYNIIIIEAGHLTKAYAMALMAPILGGMLQALRGGLEEEEAARRRHVLWGLLLFTLALILQISYNHVQITFYTALGCVAAAVAYMVTYIARKRMVRFAAVAGLLVLGAGLAFGSNARLLLVNEEYARYTMRGGNELTVTPDDLYHDNAATTSQNTSTGLDIGYAYSWSYGIGETYTLLVPGAMGGGSGERVSNNSAFYKTFRQNQAPLYWGDQPFTSGPVYFGAVVILLCLLGLLVTRGADRWWMLAASLLAILLAWGNNLMPFNEWVFNHVPFYNKFRTPSMALVLANVCMVLLASLTLHAIFRADRDRKRINQGLYIATGALAAVILGVMIASGSFSYSGASDRQMAAQYGSQWDMIFATLSADRAALLRADSWRSLIFILLAAAVLWLYNNDKLKKSGIAIAAIGVLVLIDLWGVDRRYLNNDNFVEKRTLELRRDQWDYDIDEQAARYGDHDYRVLNLAVNTFNDSKPSAFHNQIGGYSAAKLSRYQNLIDFYISNRINPQVLAMLNTRYLVLRTQQGAVVQRNPDALGNAWFVQEVKTVNSANEEILALNELNPAQTAVVDVSKYPLEKTVFETDTTAAIQLEPQAANDPDYLKYTSHSATQQLAVFSEIHYAPDWRAYLDGKPADYLRADYVLRAMVVPAGDHVIEFRNEAPRLHRLDRITLIVSIVTLLLMIGAVACIYVPLRSKKATAV